MKRILQFLDSLDFSPVTMMLTILGIATVRLFLENFSSPEATGMFAPFIGIISYASLYGMLAVLIGLGIWLLIKKQRSLLWTLRVIIFVFPLVILTPIIDLVISGGNGLCVAYAQAGDRGFFELFATYLVNPPGINCGITTGLQFQIITASIGVGLLVFGITKSWIKGILGIIVVYTASFIGGVLPIFTQWAFGFATIIDWLNSLTGSLLGSIHYPTDALGFTVFPTTITTSFLARIQLIILGILLFISWRIGSPNTWRAWWAGNLKKIPTAGIHIVLVVFGLSVGYSVGIPLLAWADWIGIIMALIGIFLAFWVVGIANDIEDVAIDKISNPDRPLASETLSLQTVRTIQYGALIFSIASIMTVNHNTTYALLVFLIVYFIHSTGIRLKRFWISSTLCISISGVASFLIGYFSLTTDTVVSHIPLVLITMVAGLMIPYSIIKDIPDIAGDTSENIKTFPVFYGIFGAGWIGLLLTICWLGLFWNTIPWFLALAVIISIIIFFIKKQWVKNKVLLLGIPTGISLLGILIHLLLFF